LRELFGSSRNGLLVARGDVDAACKSLQLLLDSPHQRAQMGRAARARYLRKFSEQKMLSATERVYRNALAH